MGRRRGRAAQRVRDLFYPHGKLIGRPGRAKASDIREMLGGRKGAGQFFRQFIELRDSIEKPATYSGVFITFKGKNRLGIRMHSKSGEPTFDVRTSYLPEVRKIKFVEDYTN